MIVDAHTNVGPTLLPETEFEFSPGLDTLSNHLVTAGVDRAVIAPLKPPDYDFDTANERLADRLADRSEFVGIGRVDPRHANAGMHARRAIEEYGLHGIKIDPWEESVHVDDPVVDRVADVIGTLQVPLWIQSGYFAYSHALSIRALATAHPDLPMVITHGGHLNISGLSLPDAMILAEETTNTYFELSGVYRHDFIQDIVGLVGADRVCFGSNAPYFLPELEVARVTEAELDDAHKEMVLGGAIEALLDI